MTTESRYYENAPADMKLLINLQTTMACESILKTIPFQSDVEKNEAVKLFRPHLREGIAKFIYCMMSASRSEAASEPVQAGMDALHLAALAITKAKRKD